MRRVTVAPGAAVCALRMLAASGGYSSRQGRRSVSPRSPARCAAAERVSTHRYARASGITPAAFVGFSPVSGWPPPLAQMAAGRGEKACAPAPRLPAPPLWPRPAGTPGQASAGGPFGRLPPSHFLVSVAVGSSGATPPPPPRRPVSPAAIKAEWGGLVGAAGGPPPAPLGPSGALQPRPPFWGPGAGLFLVSLRRE